MSVNDIICDYPYTLGPESAKNRYNILTNLTNQTVLIVEYFNKKCSLINFFKNFAALNTINKNRLVICNVINSETPNESDRLLRVLSNAFQDRDVPWQLRYKIINQLIHDFLYSTKFLSDYTGIKTKKIEDYIIKKGIPDFYKEEGIKHGCGTLLNTIYEDDAFIGDQKLILYDMVVGPKPDLQPKS
ncbi:hypothetical protein V7147_10315 [Bacillus sp. JJ1521]|uniref:hypothetical protein n=1 Tax=Bacillus sp. JJ1521 TaxID=3122957 RepID=UPI002FFEF819